MQNVIEREVTIKASRERVYGMIASPELVVKWFPEKIEGDYSVGKQVEFVFDHGTEQVFVVDARPYEYFAYRWVPGGTGFDGDVNAVANTLVEFKLSEEEDGVCKVIVTETGFANLPTEMAEKSFTQNSGGWNFMLSRLEKQFQVE